jgi:hypothetical protein
MPDELRPWYMPSNAAYASYEEALRREIEGQGDFEAARRLRMAYANALVCRHHQIDGDPVLAAHRAYSARFGDSA